MKKTTGKSGYLSIAELENPRLFARAMPKILAASRLSRGQEREAWNWRAHALRRGTRPLGLFVHMMKNPGKAREVTAEDEDQAGHDMQTQPPPTPLNRREQYQQFRKTWLWQQVRKKALRDAKYTCDDCGKRTVRTELEVHHRNYDKPWGKEEEGALAVLCHGCHRIAHGHAPGDNLEGLVAGFWRTIDESNP